MSAALSHSDVVRTLLADRLIETFDRWLWRNTRGQGREAAGQLIIAIWNCATETRTSVAHTRPDRKRAREPRTRS
jgi:hypothetical protein